MGMVASRSTQRSRHSGVVLNAIQGNLYMGRKTHPSGGFCVYKKQLEKYMSLSIERIKELLKDENVSDERAEEIRDGFRFLVEDIIFEAWKEKRKKSKPSK